MKFKKSHLLSIPFIWLDNLTYEYCEHTKQVLFQNIYCAPRELN